MGRKPLKKAEKLSAITCIRLCPADAAKIAKLRKKAKTSEARRQLNDTIRRGIFSALDKEYGG